jgi:predicted small lipoprotein YifL
MKKPITLILALSMALFLAACGSDNWEEPPPRERNTTVTDASTDADTPSENSNPLDNAPVVTTDAEETPTDPPPTLTVDWNKAANPPAGLASAPIDDFTYTYDATLRGITIEKYKGDDSQVLIPAEIEGEPVIAIAARAFENKTNLEYIYFPDSLTQIDANSFVNCSKLTLTIPEDVEIIATGGVRNIAVSVNNLVLDTRMFGINNQNRLPFFEAIAKTAFLENILYDGVTYSFTNNREATTSELYELLIGGCFESDVEIAKVWTYQYVDYSDHFDGDYGIYGIAVTKYDHRNRSAIKVEIPAMIEGAPVVSVGTFLSKTRQPIFDSRSGIIEVTIPNSVLIIESGAFSDLTSLNTINMSNSLIHIREGAFRNTSISEITLPDTLLVIELHAFSICPNLILLELPDNTLIQFLISTFMDETNIYSVVTDPTAILFRSQTYTTRDFAALLELIKEIHGE